MKSSNEKWIRFVLGMFLILYAANHFIHLVPTSYGQMPDITRHFLDSIIMFLPLLYFFEIVVGFLLITNVYTKLILIALIPMSVSFLMFNLLNKDVSMLWPAVFVAVLNIWLLWIHKSSYKHLLN